MILVSALVFSGLLLLEIDIRTSAAVYWTGNVILLCAMEQMKFQCGNVNQFTGRGKIGQPHSNCIDICSGTGFHRFRLFRLSQLFLQFIVPLRIPCTRATVTVNNYSRQYFCHSKYSLPSAEMSAIPFATHTKKNILSQGSDLFISPSRIFIHPPKSNIKCLISQFYNINSNND